MRELVKNLSVKIQRTSRLVCRSLLYRDLTVSI